MSFFGFHTTFSVPVKLNILSLFLVKPMSIYGFYTKCLMLSNHVKCSKYSRNTQKIMMSKMICLINDINVSQGAFNRLRFMRICSQLSNITLLCINKRTVLASAPSPPPSVEEFSSRLL